MAAAKEKEQPVNQQIEEALTPIRAQLEKLTEQNEDLQARNELLQEYLAGDLLKFEERIAGFEGLLGDPKAGSADAYARRVLGCLLALLQSQAIELPSSRRPLADMALDIGKPLIAENRKIRDKEKQEKVKEITDGRK